MPTKIEMPYSAWMRFQAACDGKPNRDAKVAAILEELHFCTTDGSIKFAEGAEALKALAESIYLDINSASAVN